MSPTPTPERWLIIYTSCKEKTAQYWARLMETGINHRYDEIIKIVGDVKYGNPVAQQIVDALNRADKHVEDAPTAMGNAESKTRHALTTLFDAGVVPDHITTDVLTDDTILEIPRLHGISPKRPTHPFPGVYTRRWAEPAILDDELRNRLLLVVMDHHGLRTNEARMAVMRTAVCIATAGPGAKEAVCTIAQAVGELHIRITKNMDANPRFGTGYDPIMVAIDPDTGADRFEGRWLSQVDPEERNGTDHRSTAFLRCRRGWEEALVT